MSNKYYLKIESDFSSEEIKENTQIINVNQSGLERIKENNFANDFLSHFIINLNVEGAEVEFLGKYKSEMNLCDISCVINHNANNTKSKINIRGIAKGGGKIISRSKINVKENLKNIIGIEDLKFIAIFKNDLFEEGRGEIDATPEINVLSKDVSITHSLSISKISEKELWYRRLHGSSTTESICNFEEDFLK